MQALNALFSFPDKNRANLEQFLREVDVENTEHMSYQRDFDEELECRPTFEQLSHERVVDEAAKNILVLKSFETILQERMQSFNLFLSALSKARGSFDVFQYSEGSLRQALDALFVFIEQELQQARLQQMLGDLRRKMSEVKVDAQKRLTDYQREVQDADKDVASAEKKLSKSKAQLEKCLEQKQKLELQELEPTKSPHISRYGRDGRTERIRETEESVRKSEAEIKEDTRSLLRSLGSRDQVLSASRRAYQKLDKECKRSIGSTLKKMVIREKEAAVARLAALEKLEASVDEIDVDGDMCDFIAHHRIERGSGNDNALILCSQALSILGDVASEPERVGSSSESAGPIHSSVRDIGSSLLDKAQGLLARATSPAPPSTSRSNHTSTGSATPADSLLATPVPTRPAPSTLKSATHTNIPTNNASAVPATPSRPSPEKPKKASFTAGESSEATLHLTRLFYACDSKDTLSARVSGVFNSIEMQRLLDGSNNMGATLAESLTGESAESAVQQSSNKAAAAGTAAVPVSLNSVSKESLGGLSRIKALGTDVTPAAILDHAHNLALSAGADGIRGTPEESINWLSSLVQSQPGRELFVTVLNQFRSKRVDVGGSFSTLGAVLWEALDACAAANDVHTAKVIMMLSQTFYRTEENNQLDREAFLVESARGDKPLFSPDLEEEDEGRDTGLRQYLKDSLIDHPIWHDGTFWEQVLWQCTVEQLQTIPYERAWHDMDKDQRLEAVRRVHDVVFSQVMAVTHSMMELGCSRVQTREFLYRMCVIHQLSEGQRHMLLGHLIGR